MPLYLQAILDEDVKGCPYKNLWLAVVLRAVKDACYYQEKLDKAFLRKTRNGGIQPNYKDLKNDDLSVGSCLEILIPLKIWVEEEESKPHNLSWISLEVMNDKIDFKRQIRKAIELRLDPYDIEHKPRVSFL